jgi:hypothetical protein
MIEPDRDDTEFAPHAAAMTHSAHARARTSQRGRVRGFPSKPMDLAFPICDRWCRLSWSALRTCNACRSRLV